MRKIIFAVLTFVAWILTPQTLADTTQTTKSVDVRKLIENLPVDSWGGGENWTMHRQAFDLENEAVTWQRPEVDPDNFIDQPKEMSAYIRHAYDAYSGKRKGKSYAYIAERLRLATLWADKKEERERIRAHLKRFKYPSGFVDLFEDAVSWSTWITLDDGWRAYLFYKLYGDDKTNDIRQSLAGRLQSTLFDMEYPTFLYERAQEFFASVDRKERCWGAHNLELLARKGHLRAGRELAMRYFDGDGVPKSDKAALFWVMYVAFRGIGKPSAHEDFSVLFPHMGKQDLREVSIWLWENEFPDCNEVN